MRGDPCAVALVDFTEVGAHIGTRASVDVVGGAKSGDLLALLHLGSCLLLRSRPKSSADLLMQVGSDTGRHF